jgi:hypothetical protein
VLIIYAGSEQGSRASAAPAAVLTWRSMHAEADLQIT